MLLVFRPLFFFSSDTDSSFMRFKDLFPGFDCLQVSSEFGLAVKHVLEAENYVLLPEQVNFKNI